MYLYILISRLLDSVARNLVNKSRMIIKKKMKFSWKKKHDNKKMKEVVFYLKSVVSIK